MVGDFIKRAGGATQLAAALSQTSGKPLNRAQVGMWAVRGRIPWEWRAVVYRFARDNDVQIADELIEGVVIND